MTKKPSAPVTLRQVASQAGVHLSTVSRALDPARRHQIGDEAREKVEAAARELGFRPNHAAASLRRGRTRTIATLVPTMLNPVMGQIMQGVEIAAVERGYFPVMVSTFATAPAEIIERLLAQRIDGVVVATAPSDDTIVRALIAAGVNAVMLDRGDDTIRVSSVGSDRLHAMTLAIDHLYDLGHRHIALLAGPQSLVSGRRRQVGAQDALARHGLKPAAMVVCQSYAREAGRDACRQLLAERRATAEGFTAICAASDMLALGAYDAISEAGLSIPGDLSVVGQNDMVLMDLVQPPLTTVRVPHQDMGRAAAKLLIDEIDAARSEPSPTSLPPLASLTFQPELVLRRSTAAPAAPESRSPVGT